MTLVVRREVHFNMISGPLVSVAIITYNQREFLHDCIESVLAQTYKNLEIVVADDGSKDGTHEMLLDYQQRFPNKFVLRLSEQNKGITTNSNEAHFACTGKYIAWMGGDDLMLPEKIEKQVEYMEANPNCTICYHDLDVFDSATGDTLYRFNQRHKPREGGVETCIRYGVFNGACASMVRADKAPKDGFNSRLPVASDWMYWIDSLANGGTINFLNSTLGRYRRHGGNVTSSGSNQNRLDHWETLDLVNEHYPMFDGAEKKARARLFYTDGVVSLLNGNSNKCRRELVTSLRTGWVSWKIVYWLIKSFVSK